MQHVYIFTSFILTGTVCNACWIINAVLVSFVMFALCLLLMQFWIQFKYLMYHVAF